MSVNQALGVEPDTDARWSTRSMGSHRGHATARQNKPHETQPERGVLNLHDLASSELLRNDT
jgi:hypothetical protein